MRYYHYISQSKCDMLFPQIPSPFLDKVNVELGFDFGLLKGKVGGSVPPLESQVAKCQAIDRFLESEGAIHAEKPVEHQWFKCMVDLKVGSFNRNPGVTFFSGVLKDNFLLFTGSSSNLVSGVDVKGTVGGSSMHFIQYLAYLERQEANNIPTKQRQLQSLTLDRWARQIALYPHPPIGFATVLARVFTFTDTPDYKVTIGTPLYVYTD